MKKLFTAAMLIASIVTFAQVQKETNKRAETEKFTPNQQNELQLKKMTLELDLNAKQQEQMKAIIAEKTAKRNAMMEERKEKKTKPTTDERFSKKSKMLDEQIAMKAKMKTILSPEQFTKWDKMKGNKNKKRSLAMHKKMGSKMDQSKQIQK
jgi:hypothetical protein